MCRSSCTTRTSRTSYVNLLVTKSCGSVKASRVGIAEHGRALSTPRSTRIRTAPARLGLHLTREMDHNQQRRRESKCVTSSSAQMVHVARGAVVRLKSESIAKSDPSNFANHTITRSGSIALTEPAKRPRTCRTNTKFGTTTHEGAG